MPTEYTQHETVRTEPPTLVERAALQQVVDVLSQQGYRVVGPTVRENVIVYDDLSSVEQLPIGYKDTQEGGSYWLKQTKEPLLFGYVLGPESWKKYLSPPHLRLWQAQRANGTIHLIPENTLKRQQHTSEGHETLPGAPDPAAPHHPLALFGARACELAAIAVQDRVFLQGPYVDPIYRAQRENLFIVAVNCTRPGGTCFCTSMRTGPKATHGFDLALTEVYAPPRHYFIVEVGSDAGAAVLAAIPHQPAGAADVQAADSGVAQAATEMSRSIDTTNIKTLLYDNFEHPRWENVASRCLTCGNCTMVCPTCFCTTVEDTVDLDGTRAARWRKWDSCFTMDYSYIYGGSGRASSKSRYRQWMTHKLASWIDQFGTSGCVGCGRCITWCPVGIDITAEVSAIRFTSDAAANNSAQPAKTSETG
ncbi:MAG: sulfite reductase subunit A [Chloroflexi bacterium]|nr:sulfite reductase subunit A [Chloroflexota bacterium]